MKKYLNSLLILLLILIVVLALYYQLGDFAHLKNANGMLTDMRSMVLWDIRFPRIGLALLTGGCQPSDCRQYDARHFPKPISESRLARQ